MSYGEVARPTKSSMQMSGRELLPDGLNIAPARLDSIWTRIRAHDPPRSRPSSLNHSAILDLRDALR